MEVQAAEAEAAAEALVEVAAAEAEVLEAEAEVLEAEVEAVDSAVGSAEVVEMVDSAVGSAEGSATAGLESESTHSEDHRNRLQFECTMQETPSRSRTYSWIHSTMTCSNE